MPTTKASSSTTSVGVRPCRVQGSCPSLGRPDHDESTRRGNDRVGMSGPLRSTMLRGVISQPQLRKAKVLLRRSRARGEGRECTRWIHTSAEIDGDLSIIIGAETEKAAPIALTTRSGIRKHHKQRTVAVGHPDQLIHLCLVGIGARMLTAAKHRIVAQRGSSISPSAFAAWNVRPIRRDERPCDHRTLLPANRECPRNRCGFWLGVTSERHPSTTLNQTKSPPDAQLGRSAISIGLQQALISLLAIECMLHAWPLENASHPDPEQIDPSAGRENPRATDRNHPKRKVFGLRRWQKVETDRGEPPSGADKRSTRLECHCFQASSEYVED